MEDNVYFQGHPPATPWGNCLPGFCHKSSLIILSTSGEGWAWRQTEFFVSPHGKENKSTETTLCVPLLSTLECPVPLLSPLPALESAPGPGVAGPVGSEPEFPRDKALIHQLSPDMAAPSRFLEGQ